MKSIYPREIFTYIRNHYPGSIIVNCHRRKEKNDRFSIVADLIQNHHYHHIRFDDAGRFVSEEVESAFEEGYHEQYF